VIEKGEITETGTHDELVGKGGIYSTYCQIQYNNGDSSSGLNNAGQ
jgi:ABC-type multidrug transport system fused ATPase/permease subunit